MVEFDTPNTHAAAKVRDYLQNYIDKSEAGEDIDLKKLAIDCNYMIQYLYEEDGLIIYPDNEPTKRLVSLSFTQEDSGNIKVNLQAVEL